MVVLRSPAVQMVKTTCTESKKKNMTSRETEAPMGRNRACVESMVWIPAEGREISRTSRKWPQQHLKHSLLLVLPLLKAPGAMGFPSLSFSWFSQSMFNDLRDGREREREHG